MKVIALSWHVTTCHDVI